MFKKPQVDWVIADIYQFGTVIRNNASNSPSEFIPAPLLQVETHITKQIPSKILQEPSSLRSELQLSKMSSVTQMPENVVN